MMRLASVPNLCEPGGDPMAMSRLLVPAFGAFASFSVWSGAALALTVPDTGTCPSNTSSICLKVTQNSTAHTGFSANLPNGGIYAIVGSSDSSTANGNGVFGNANAGGTGVGGFSATGDAVNGTTSGPGTGVHGVNSGTGIGVKGENTHGVGVQGISSTYVGVYGHSVSHNAVYGENSDTSGTIPAISAYSGSASTGTAYYGNGGIIISSGTAEKAGGGGWTATSDARVKKDVAPFTKGLNEVLKVRPVSFQYNGLGGTVVDGRTYVGVIAQEIEKVDPAMVTTRKARLHSVDTQEVDIKRVDPSEFTYLLINAVKEQQKLIQEQGDRIVALESRGSTVTSSILPSGRTELAFMLGLLPVGLVVAARRRRKD
jgi:hypothetical protein